MASGSCRWAGAVGPRPLLSIAIISHCIAKEGTKGAGLVPSLQTRFICDLRDPAMIPPAVPGIPLDGISQTGLRQHAVCPHSETVH